MASDREKMRSAFDSFLDYATESKTGDIIIPESSASVLVGDAMVTFSLRRSSSMGNIKDRVITALGWCKVPTTSSVIANKIRFDVDDVQMVLDDLLSKKIVKSILTDRRYRGEYVVKYELERGIK